MRDGDCLAFVEGCRTQEVRPRESATVLVLLEPRPEQGCAVGEQCSAGHCRVPDAAAADSGAADAAQGDLLGRDVSFRDAGADAHADAGGDAHADAAPADRVDSEAGLDAAPGLDTLDSGPIPQGAITFVGLAATSSNHACAISSSGDLYCWGSDFFGQLGDDATLANKHVPTAVDTTNLDADGKAFTRISVGSRGSCGLTGKGRVFCWGSNLDGQLGSGSFYDEATPVAVDTTNLDADAKGFSQIAVGSCHACGISLKGKAFCWGEDWYGQLGNSTGVSDSELPIPVDTANLDPDDKSFVQITAGNFHTCGITGRGKVFCWGVDSDGQLGDGATIADQAIPVAVDTAALSADDKAFVQVSVGANHTCAITGRGKAFCWGDDDSGQLGNDEDIADAPVPVAVDATALSADDKAFVKISAGKEHTCAITGMGKAFCWGRDDDGQLGDDAGLVARHVPVAVDTTNLAADDKAFVEIAAGYRSTCGLTGKGRIFCWGDDQSGQLGDDVSLVDQPIPVAVDTAHLAAADKSFVQITAGDFHTCGIAGEGMAFCWGHNRNGQLGDGTQELEYIPVAVDPRNLSAHDKAFTQIVTGGDHTCGLTAAGQVFCWGYDGKGQLGDGGDLVDRIVPAAIDTASLEPGDMAFRQITANKTHTCGITVMGKAFCWGDDAAGQLGDDDNLVGKTIPVAVDTAGLQTGGLRYIAAGESHTCAVTAMGQALCWGSDQYGQLGDDATCVNKHLPVVVATAALPSAAKSFVKVLAGWDHTCGIAANGQALCWGRDRLGALGDDYSFANKSLPVAVDVTNLPADDKFFAGVSAGNEYSCGVTGKGRAYCWGNESYGELGNDEILCLSYVPVAVATLNFPADDKCIVDIAASRFHTCGITGRGKAFCWGQDSDGALGDGAGWGNKPLPSPVDTTNLP
ncbi:MAG: hypothetical protein JXR83_23155 [Deltaproteobacteria bacterium]|nr:hypothetical protein [Deltaproteobacteria bacterium]